MGYCLFMRKGELHTEPKQCLPSGYTELAFIQSSGTQYIDTGIIPNQNTKIVFDFQVTDSESSSFLALFGSRTDGSLNCFNMWLQNNTVYVQYGNVDYDAYSISIIRNNRYSFTLDSNVATIGDSSVTLPALTFSGSKQITLFALNREGNTVDSRRTSGKLYSCKIYDNNVLVRNFVPCINPSGEVGLYDLVGKQFYGNTGTGVFTGSEVA